MKLTSAIPAALSILLVACSAIAQGNCPEKSVRILVGFSPGVALDLPTMAESGHAGIKAGE